MHADICHVLLGYPLDRVRVLDTETTGISAVDDEILSVAIVDGYGNELLNTYVRPTRHAIWPDAELVNGITPSMVADAPTISEVKRDIHRLLDGGVLLVGYNISFDIRMLQGNGALPHVLPVRSYDVMREYARIHGEERWGNSDRWKYSKLEECARHYGYEFEAHDALEDTKATAFCLRSLLCDPDYIRFMRRTIKPLRGLSLTQTDATRDAIIATLDGHTFLTMDGTVEIGEITRGKNKGEKRLECHVGGLCVGNLSRNTASKVLRRCGYDRIESMDEPIPAEVTLFCIDGRYSCTLDIETPLDVGVEAFAEDERGKLETAKLAQEKRVALMRAERILEEEKRKREEAKRQEEANARLAKLEAENQKKLEEERQRAKAEETKYAQIAMIIVLAMLLAAVAFKVAFF